MRSGEVRVLCVQRLKVMLRIKTMLAIMYAALVYATVCNVLLVSGSRCLPMVLLLHCAH
jgi:hypothetical protein